MNICTYTETIYQTECLSESVKKINRNFNSLALGYNLVTPIIDEFNIVSSNKLKRALTTVRGVNSALATLAAQLRLSLSPYHSVHTENIISKKLYLHAYNGNTVSLFSNKYNSWINRDIFKQPNGQALSFNLKDSKNIDLPPQTTYDVFLSWLDDKNTFALYFAPWDTMGYGVSNIHANRTYINGVCVYKHPVYKTVDRTKRFIGCIRITSQGASEQSVGGVSKYGLFPKQYVWNYNNRVYTHVQNMVTGNYTNVDITEAPDRVRWNRTCSSVEGETQINYNKFSFIIGDYTDINLNYYSNFDTQETATVYNTVFLNDYKQFDNISNIKSNVTVFTGKSINTTSTYFKGIIQPGCHVLQTYDASNKFVQFNTIADESFRCGFSSGVVN